MEKWKNDADLSLLKPLSDELNISLNELLSGEKLENKNIIENTKNTLINTINYSNRKIKKTKNFIIILLTIIIFIITVITLFTIDVN